MKKLALIGLVALGMLSAGARAAEASTITYDLTIDHCSGGCGSSPFGSVQLTDIAGGVAVHVTLNNSNVFLTTGFDGAFGFNLTTNPFVTFTGLTSGFTATNGPAGSHQFDGFGNFEYIVNCCPGGGASDTHASPLDFNVIAAGVNIGSFAALSSGPGSDHVFFVADILSGTTGRTGPVGGGTCLTCGPDIQVVPEPASLILLGSGLFGAVAVARRRRRLS